MLGREIPLKFIEQFRRLHWREVLLGLVEGWLGPQVAVDLAIRSLEAGSNDPDEIALAGLLKSELSSAREIVERLAQTDTATESAAKETWLRLLIAWLYENRALVPEPLAVIEELYADFGYPDEIRHLVRYNETTRGPETPELARQRMIQDWQEYVDGLRRKAD